MRHYDAEQELTILVNTLRGILEDEGVNALENAKQQINAQKKPKRRKKSRRRSGVNLWKLVISPSSPLLFRKCTIRRQCYQVDLFCNISQLNSNGRNSKNSLTIRIWSTDGDICFREEFDSELARSEFDANGKRVLFRFHFDQANEEQEGPEFHFQVGGIPQGNEICWFPKSLNIPRFIHHPMNLILACEYIVANFFPEEWREISRETTWLAAIRKAQESFLKPYYDGIQSGWTATENSLLKHLWNIP